MGNKSSLAGPLLVLSLILFCFLREGRGALSPCFNPSPPPANAQVVISGKECVIYSGDYVVSSFIVNASTVHVLLLDPSDESTTNGVLITANHFEVSADSDIVALGYAADAGPGKGTFKTNYPYAGGATHASRGNFNLRQNPTPYGDFKHPVSLGSGGGSRPNYPGGTGGGAIHVRAGNFANYGKIVASGEDGSSTGGFDSSGGGSGGSVSLIEKRRGGRRS